MMIPKEMNCIQITKFGGSENLVLAKRKNLTLQ